MHHKAIQKESREKKHNLMCTNRDHQHHTDISQIQDDTKK